MKENKHVHNYGYIESEITGGKIYYIMMCSCGEIVKKVAKEEKE